MLDTATAPAQISPLASLPAALGPISRLPSKQRAVGAKIAPAPSDIAFTVVAVFRQHGHIGNVLTHISHTNWTNIEQALRAVIDPNVDSQSLSPLAQNIVELVCGERGVTGQITKPYFRTVLSRILGTDDAAQLIERIDSLFVQLECARHQPPNTARIANQLSAATEPN